MSSIGMTTMANPAFARELPNTASVAKLKARKISNGAERGRGNRANLGVVASENRGAAMSNRAADVAASEGAGPSDRLNPPGRRAPRPWQAAKMLREGGRKLT